MRSVLLIILGFLCISILVLAVLMIIEKLFPKQTERYCLLIAEYNEDYSECIRTIGTLDVSFKTKELAIEYAHSLNGLVGKFDVDVYGRDSNDIIGVEFKYNTGKYDEKGMLIYEHHLMTVIPHRIINSEKDIFLELQP